MDKVYIRVQTKTAQKPYPMGRHIYMAYIREYPHLPPLPLTGSQKVGFYLFHPFLEKLFPFQKALLPVLQASIELVQVSSSRNDYSLCDD